MKAGILGVGNMGGGIARRLLAQGVHLYVFDPSDIAVEKLGVDNVTRCASPKKVADQAAITFACLPTISIAETAGLGADGAIHGTAIKTYVEFSTIGPRAALENALRFNEQNVGYVDAPVSGVAEAGKLTIMLAAANDQIDAVRPVLQRITESLFVIGSTPGDAQTMKLINNILLAANMATSAEALVLGTRLGLDPAMMVNVINASSGRSLVTAPQRMRAILGGSFDTGPLLLHLCKDIELAAAQIAEASIPSADLPSLEGVISLWRRAIGEGLGPEDVSAIIKVVERKLGVEARSETPLAG